MSFRYAYRLKGEASVTLDYAAKAPATSDLYQHIRYATKYAHNDAEVKSIAKRDYELVTYRLVEEKEYQSLQESAAWLGHLENAGVDNWEGISFAYELKREGEEE